MMLFLQGDLKGDLARQNKWYFFRLNHILLTESWTTPSLQLVLHIPSSKWTQGPNVQQTSSFINKSPSLREGTWAVDRLLAPWRALGRCCCWITKSHVQASSQRPAAGSNSVACIIAVNRSRRTGRLGCLLIAMPHPRRTHDSRTVLALS